MLFLDDGDEVLSNYDSVAYNPTGDLIAAAVSNDGIVQILDAKSGKVVTSLAGLNGSIGASLFMPDGASLLVGESSRLRTWDLSTGNAAPPRPTDFIGSPAAMIFSPDQSTMLAVGSVKSNGNRAYVFSARTFETLAFLTPPDRYIYTTGAYTPDGKFIVTGNVWHIDFWDSHTYHVKNSFQACNDPDKEYRQSSLSVSPDGATITFSCRSDTAQYLRFMDSQTGKAQDVPVREQFALLDAKYSPDGKILAASVYSGNIHLLDARTHQVLSILSTGTSAVNSFAFSPDSSLLAAGTGDGTVQLWDVATRTNRTVFSFQHFGITFPACPGYGTDAECRGFGHAINGLAFSADGTLIATGSEDGVLRLFGISTS